MPFTATLFVSRKPGLTPTEFRNYWENTHVPLAKSLVGPYMAHTIERHYVAQSEDEPGTYSPSMLMGAAADVNFDAYAILTFEDRAAFERLIGRLQDPEIGGKIQEDEARFIEQAKTRLVLESESVVDRKG